MTDAELILWLRLEDTSLTDFAADRIEELKAKLAKAVEDLQDMLTIPNSEAAQGILKAYARALIAELTGGKDD